MCSPCACGYHLGTGYPGLYSFPPLEPLGFYYIVGSRKQKPKQLLRTPPSRLRVVAKKELSQLCYFQEAGGQLPYKTPEILLSAKYTKVGLYGLTIK